MQDKVFWFEKKDLQKNKSALRLPWDRVVRPGPDYIMFIIKNKSKT